MLKIALVLGFAVTAAAETPLVTFDGVSNTTFTFKELNDPVMGGNSNGTWEREPTYGVFDGVVVNVPSLKAPGFIKAAADGTFVDVSSELSGGLNLKVRSTTPEYAGFRVAFASGTLSPDYACAGGSTLPFSGGCYKSKFSVAAGADFATVHIPFNTFSDHWSPATGEQTKTCADDASVCPTVKTLASIIRIEIWAEGVDGDIHLELASVSAGGAPAGTIVDLAVATNDLSTLVTYLTAGALVETLSGPGPFTVFAPSNEAFAELSASILAELLDPIHIDILDKVLTYHVASGSVHAADLTDGEKIPTVCGQDVIATINATGVFINDAQVTTADVDASNGVVHIIDAVLFPNFNVSLSAGATPAGTIVDLAIATPELSTLAFALAAGALVETLSGPGPFTVFAPTNKAFSKLPADILADLLDPKNIKLLDDVLTYHVASGSVHAADLTNGEKIPTVEGKVVVVNLEAGRVFINQAEVITADVDASNGVVHIIDAVLLD